MGFGMRFPRLMFSAILGCVIGLGSGSAVSAQQGQCALPQDVFALATGLAMLPDNGRISTSQAQTIARRLGQVNENQVLSELRSTGLESVSPVVIDMLAEAQRISTNSTLRGNGSLRDILYRLEHQVAIACMPGTSTVFQNFQKSDVASVFRADEVDWDEIERILQENKTVSASALLVALAGFIVALYLFDLGFRWIMALVYNRKICRIAARLEVDGRLLRGHIVTLGRGGCRFYARDAILFEDVHIALLRDGGTLTCGEEDEYEIDVIGRNIHELAADVAFDDQLSLRQQRDMLKLSSVTPYTVSKSRGGGHDVTDAVAQGDDDEGEDATGEQAKTPAGSLNSQP